MKFVANLLEKLIVFIEVVLGARFLLSFLGASPAAEVVKFFYSTTNFLIKPFTGIFNVFVLKGGGVIDTVVLSAMVSYAILFWLIKKIFLRR
ncbi:YggT family protein [Patescibacteria group bacterium]|nr:YggT family protein [Patescibacteria group bacterium]